MAKFDSYPVVNIGAGDYLLIQDVSDTTDDADGSTKRVLADEFLAIAGTPVQGDIAYFNGTVWTVLNAGTSGQFLQTLGSSANPQWGTPSGGGTLNASGTPVANRMAYWIDADTLGHESGFTYDPTTDTLTVSKIVIGGVTFDGTSQLADPDQFSVLVWDDVAGTTAWAGLASVALTDGATITPNFSSGRNFHVTLGGNRTLANPTNQAAGQAGRIRVTQDGTGSRTLAYGTAWKFPGGAPTLSTAAGAVDMICYDVHASGTIYATLLKAFA